MIEKKKIGLGIVTYQRFDRFKKCYDSVIKNMGDLDEIIVVDDCSTIDREKYDAFFDSQPPLQKTKFIVLDENGGVAKAKNTVLEYLFDKTNCDVVFTLEDDQIIKHEDCWKEYVVASDDSGIEYLNFAHHGPANVPGSIETFPNTNIALYGHCVGALSLHTRNLYETIGLYDDAFVNAWEHVEYYYRASLKQLCPRFWYFADIINSKDFITEQEGSIDDSSIRVRKDWMHNIEKGGSLFEQKHNIKIMEIPK